jgi:hypothetical protein
MILKITIGIERECEDDLDEIRDYGYKDLLVISMHLPSDQLSFIEDMPHLPKLPSGKPWYNVRLDNICVSAKGAWGVKHDSVSIYCVIDSLSERMKYKQRIKEIFDYFKPKVEEDMIEL